MSTEFDYFYRGITRAMRRRAKQPAKQHLDQVVHVQGVGSVAGDSNTINTVNNAITKLSDEEYKQIIVQTMIAFIHKRKK